MYSTVQYFFFSTVLYVLFTYLGVFLPDAFAFVPRSSNYYTILNYIISIMRFPFWLVI